jgi:hypothetical protein
MKVLVLVMAHETEDAVFKGYKDVWDKKLSIIKNKGYNIDVLFLYSNENLSEKYTIIDNNLYTKCKENYWNSLLLKSMSGLDFFIKNDYDLVFKTNLSTIINLERFIECCSNIYDLSDYVYYGAIGDYKDYKFVSGAGILLNKKSVKLLIDNESEITSEWTDDIFLGYILNKKHNIEPKVNCLNRYDLITKNQYIDPDIVKNSTHIRIKVRVGNEDIEFSNKIYSILYE